MANITITEGDTLEVDYSVENTGDGTGDQDVRLEIQDVLEDTDTNVVLDPGQTTTGTLQWQTQSGDAVTDALAEALTDDTSDSITVSVESPDNVELWERTDPLSDWSGSTTDFSVASPAPEGNNSLEHNGAGETIISRTSGVDATPAKGDRFSSLLREIDTLDSLRPGFGYAWDGGSAVSGYFVTIQFGTVDIIRYDDEVFNTDNGTTILSESASISDGEWYEFEINWHDGTGGQPENTHELTVYEIDSSLKRSGQILTGSVQDATYSNQTGISVGVWRNLDSVYTVHDRYVRY